MIFDEEARVFLIYVAVILAAFFLGRMVLFPAKMPGKILGNMLLAAIVITVFICLLNEMHACS